MLAGGRPYRPVRTPDGHSVRPHRHGHWLIEWTTASLALAHGLLAWLHLIDRVVPALRPGPNAWAGVFLLESPYWAVAHSTVFLLLIATLICRRYRPSVAQYLGAAGTLASVPLWGLWLLMLWLWGASTVPPTSLTAPALTASFSLPISALLAVAWITREDI